jgi:hypothetical protein
VFWPDGKLAADELPFFIETDRENWGRQMTQEL